MKKRKESVAQFDKRLGINKTWLPTQEIEGETMSNMTDWPGPGANPYRSHEHQLDRIEALLREILAALEKLKDIPDVDKGN